MQTPTEQEELKALWEAAARESVEALEREREVIGQDVAAQYMVLALCRDEGQQLELLGRFAAEGLDCKALLS